MKCEKYAVDVAVGRLGGMESWHGERGPGRALAFGFVHVSGSGSGRNGAVLVASEIPSFYYVSRIGNKSYQDRTSGSPESLQI